MGRKFDAIVIGSGLGGLTAGGLCARAGMRVLVVERNEAFVGAATIFHHNGLAIESSLHEIELGIDVTRMLERVKETKAEFEEYEDARADHMQDEWKERWRDERDSERSVSDMFGSLKGDRG